MHCKRGDFNENLGGKLPEIKVLTIETVKKGLIHGQLVKPWVDVESMAAASL